MLEWPSLVTMVCAFDCVSPRVVEQSELPIVMYGKEMPFKIGSWCNDIESFHDRLDRLSAWPA